MVDNSTSLYIAKDLLMYDTEEYYRADESQYTVHCSPHHYYNDILNNLGKELLEKVRKQVRFKMFKGTIDSWTLEHKRSGTWTNNISHPRYEARDVNAIVCSWNNRVLCGEVRQDPNREKISTSFVRFYDLEEGWVSTLSKSLYRLGTKRFEKKCWL